jgi:hypothetical protein
MTCLCRKKGWTEVWFEPILNPVLKIWWDVSTTLRPFYPLKRPGVSCTGGLAGLGADLFLKV